MKKLRLALTVAILISGMFFSQASAEASPSASAAGSCGSTYTVVAGDTLTSIAAKCGLTVSGILSNNPSITNPNLIYRGQVLNLTGLTSTTPSGTTGGVCGKTYTVVGGDYLALIASRCSTTVNDILYNNPSITNPNLIYVGQVLKMTGTSVPSSGGTTYSGSAYITISATSANPGDTIVVKAYDFPKNSSIDFRVGKKGSDYTNVYDGTTDANGYAKKTVTIPTSASSGQDWVIKVLTTDRANVVSVTSALIHITSGSGSGNTGDEDVTLSKYSANPGANILVTVTGFPSNQDIDYCVRKSGSSTCKVVYDGKTDGDGEDTQTITIPSSALSGQTWVVQVKTTNLVTPVLAVSGKITIK